MNLYRNGGRVREVVAEAQAPPHRPPPPHLSPPPETPEPRSGTAGRALPGTLRDIKRSLDGVFTRFDPQRWEVEDLLIAAILYLLYRENGDREWLIALGAYLLL